MWRFAVYTQKTTVLSKTCMRTVRQALKHTDGRTDYFRFSSIDAASSIRTEKDQPIREVLSLDDFGLLSSNRSQSIESMSSTGDTFLENLFRNDTLNAFSNVQIPTTMSSLELGSSDVFGYDYVSELLSEGAIPEEIAEDLALDPSSSETDITKSLSESAMYHDDQEPSTSGMKTRPPPFLILDIDEKFTNEEKRDTRQIMTEKLRRERKLNLSTTAPSEASEDEVSTHLFHVKESSVIPSVGEMLFPDHVPLESYTSHWKEGEAPEYVSVQYTPTATPDIHSPAEFSLDVLEGLMTEDTKAELLADLKGVGFWPEWIFTGHRRTISRVNHILRFVVEHSVDYEDAVQIIKNYASSNVMAVVPDDIILRLTTKSIDTSTNIQNLIARLENASTVSMSRELRPNRSLVETHLAELYLAAIKKCPEAALNLLTLCSKLNFDRSADTFMKCYGENQASKGNFLTTFGEWKKLSTKYGTLQGIDNFWMAALSCDGAIEKRIEALLLHSGKTEHPFSTMARMICTLLKLDQFEKALEVFQTVSVSGKYFKDSLASFVENNDAESIERLATLIARGMISEKRRGGRQQAANKSAVEAEKKRLLSDGVHAVLEKFYGVGGQKKKTKCVDRKLKKKIYRVDEAQMHDLCQSIQKAWIQCANSKEAMTRLQFWCQSNRIEIDEKVQKKIISFSE